MSRPLIQLRSLANPDSAESIVGLADLLRSEGFVLADGQDDQGPVVLHLLVAPDPPLQDRWAQIDPTAAGQWIGTCTTRALDLLKGLSPERPSTLVLLWREIAPAHSPDHCTDSLMEALFTGLVPLAALSLAPHSRIVGLKIPGTNTKPTRNGTGSTLESSAQGWCANAAEAADLCNALRFVLEANAITGQVLALGSSTVTDWQNAPWFANRPNRPAKT
ncbi:MAG: hypothetical protein ACPGOY_06490 [Rhodospirillaceae bacterium]